MFKEIGVQSHVVVIPRNQKMIRDAYFLNTQYYELQINDKSSYPRKGVASSHTPGCVAIKKGTVDRSQILSTIFYFQNFSTVMNKTFNKSTKFHEE